ncbi:MAG: hypothetical protein ACRBM6_14905 [Geminicoccales bacterium]
MNNRQMRNFAQDSGEGRLAGTWLADDHDTLHPQNILCFGATVKRPFNGQLGVSCEPKALLRRAGNALLSGLDDRNSL